MKRLLLCLACLPLLGCEVDSFVRGPSDAAPDASTLPDGGEVDGNPSDSGDASADGVADAEPLACDLQKPFGVPVLVGGLAAGFAEVNARLSPDELTTWFASDRLGTFDVFVATRPTRLAPFGPASSVFGSTTENETGITVSADGLTAVLAVGWTLSGSVRPNTVTPFPVPTALATVNDGVSPTYSPYLQPSLQSLYFASKRGTAGVDLYRAPAAGGGAFGAPVMLAISSPSDDLDPVVTADEKTLYFASDRPGGAGGVDVYVATRASVAVPFSGVTPVSAVNTALDEQPTWISPDGCRLYLQSNRSGSLSKVAIYVATRPS